MTRWYVWFGWRDAVSPSASGIDAQVTVVDGFNFYKDYCAGESLMDRKMAAFTGDERTVVDLLIDQIEFSDGSCGGGVRLLGATSATLVSWCCGAVLILNKMDLITEDQRAFLHALLARLNPDAKILDAVQSKVDVSACSGLAVLHVSSCDWNLAYPIPRAADRGLEHQEVLSREGRASTRLAQGAQVRAMRVRIVVTSLALSACVCCRGEHVPETVEYSISSFVFRATRPFHAPRLHALVTSTEGPLVSVVRSKGVCWLAIDTSYDYSMLWGQAGAVFQFSYASRWWASGNLR